jgi:hypothetical protein
LVGLVPPTCAAYLPECDVVLMAVVPVDVQPLRVPVSKSPFVRAGAALTVWLTAGDVLALKLASPP